MHYLNDQNGASSICLGYCTKLIEEPHDKPLIGAEFGVAFGGGVQRLGKLWKPHGGTVYGFDTFTGHPKHLVQDQSSMEAICMDCWYGAYGKDLVSYEYIRGELDKDKLDNVILRKGLIDEHSLDGIPYLHYALLDVDIVSVMRTCWEITRPKMLPGGYLCLHDVLPLGHIPGLWELYQEILATGEYELGLEAPRSMLAVCRRLP